MITTAVYPNYQKNPPGIGFMGRKTWAPGKNLSVFITTTLGISLREQTQIVERIAEAMTEVGPMVRTAMNEHPGFTEIGKRMLQTWQEGLGGLRDKRTYAMGEASLGESFAGFSGPAPVKTEHSVIGRSDLLGGRK